jgi:hypothetical protein
VADAQPVLQAAIAHDSLVRQPSGQTFVPKALEPTGARSIISVEASPMRRVSWVIGRVLWPHQ